MATRSVLARTLTSLLVGAALLISCIPAPVPEPPTPTATQVPGPSAAEYASEADIFLKALVDMGLFSGAVLVARDQEILFSKGYGLADREQETPNTPQTQFRLVGIGVQFTAMAILILQDQGKLEVQDPICTYLSGCPAAWEPITIHHLLVHSSGLPGYIGLMDPGRLATPLPPEDLISLISDSPLEYQPGEKIDFWVGGTEAYLLAQIIEQASGVSYDEFLQQNIFAPLEMQHTGPVDAQANLALGYDNDSSHLAPAVDKSIEPGGTALASTVEDLLRWDQALYTEKLVAQALLDEMFADRGGFTGNGAEMADDTGRSGAAYLGYAGEQFGRRDFLYWGILPGSADLIDRYPDDWVTIIVLSNQGNVDATVVATGLAKRLFPAE